MEQAKKSGHTSAIVPLLQAQYTSMQWCCHLIVSRISQSNLFLNCELLLDIVL